MHEALKKDFIISWFMIYLENMALDSFWEWKECVQQLQVVWNLLVDLNCILNIVKQIDNPFHERVKLHGHWVNPHKDK